MQAAEERCTSAITTASGRGRSILDRLQLDSARHGGGVYLRRRDARGAMIRISR